MKKFALALASMLLVLSAAGAVAAVPSKTTTDVTRVKAVESTEPTMLIEVTEDEMCIRDRAVSARRRTGCSRGWGGRNAAISASQRILPRAASGRRHGA